MKQILSFYIQPAKNNNLDIGGIVGVNSGTVRNCTFTGTVSGNERVGGIVGRNKVSGVIESCSASGMVYGNHYIGGIAGENLGVIRSCVNKAEVNAQVDHNSVSVGGVTLESLTAKESISDAANIGGITGTSSGVIRACENRANIGYEKMGYNVGGIAGNSETYIVDSFSRSILAGSQYVGGIAGFGTEVVGCYAITDIAAATKFAGGILGYTEPLPDEEMGRVLENRYYLTGENLGGIDGICYEGATASMTIGEFLAAEKLDDIFRTVTVRFLAEGQEDVVLTVDLGKTIPVAKIPELEVGEHELYQWQLIPSVTSETLGMGETVRIQYISKERLTNLFFDQTYEAVFDAKNTVVASEKKAESGRSLALAVGAFDQGTTLRLTNITEQEASVAGVAVQENWQVTMADIGVEKLHYHIPNGQDAERIVLYVKDISGNWIQRDFTVEGSYMIFPFTHGESGFALELLPEEEFPVTTVVISVAAAMLVLIAGKTIKKRRAKKKGTVSEKK